MKPVVRNIGTSDLYFYLGNDEWENIRTGKKGKVAEEKAKEVFKMNIEATEIINEYPEVENLIKTLNLKFDVGSLQMEGR